MGKSKHRREHEHREETMADPPALTPRQRLDLAFQAVLNYDGPRPGDPRPSIFDGVVSERLYLHSTDSRGRRHGKTRPWNWNPLGLAPPMHVHRDGHTTAHGGTVGEPARESDEEQLARGAGLTQEELAVLRAKLDTSGQRNRTYAEIAQLLGLTVRVVERRLESAARKVRAYAEIVRQLGAGLPKEET